MDDVKNQVLQIALYMLDHVGKKGKDHRTIWDLYFNTLTYPGWDKMIYKGSDDEREHLKRRPKLEKSEPGEENSKEAKKKWDEFKKKETEWVEEKRSYEGKPGSAIDIFGHMKHEEGVVGAAIWSPSLYDHAIPALMQNIPHARKFIQENVCMKIIIFILVIKTFKGNGDFYFTWPLPFVMHHAAEEDEEPAYTKPVVLGSGSSLKKHKKSRLPHVDYAVVWFLSDSHKGGDLLLSNPVTGKNITIEARHNRAVMFTTGSENVMNWQKVTEGKLVYMMFHFSCEQRYDMSSNGKQSAFLPYG